MKNEKRFFLVESGWTIVGIDKDGWICTYGVNYKDKNIISFEGYRLPISTIDITYYTKSWQSVKKILKDTYIKNKIDKTV